MYITTTTIDYNNWFLVLEGKNSIKATFCSSWPQGSGHVVWHPSFSVKSFLDLRCVSLYLTLIYVFSSSSFFFFIFSHACKGLQLILMFPFKLIFFVNYHITFNDIWKWHSWDTYNYNCSPKTFLFSCQISCFNDSTWLVSWKSIYENPFFIFLFLEAIP